jgi:hypothetical protein
LPRCPCFWWWASARPRNARYPCAGSARPSKSAPLRGRAGPAGAAMRATRSRAWSGLASGLTGAAGWRANSRHPTRQAP